MREWQLSARDFAVTFAVCWIALLGVVAFAHWGWPDVAHWSAGARGFAASYSLFFSGLSIPLGKVWRA